MCVGVDILVMHPLLAVALFLFLAFLLFYVVEGVFLVYHLLRFSVRRDVARVGTSVFLIVSFALIAISLGYILRISWDAPAFRPYGLPATSRIL